MVNIEKIIGMKIDNLAITIIHNIITIMNSWYQIEQ